MKMNSIMQKPWTYKLGIFLIIISVLTWILSPVLIPFLPLTNGVKAISITTTLVIGEVIFWIGTLMVGKEVANKIRKSFNPKNWKKKKSVYKKKD
ncbi:transporter suffix domain-containing protein [Pontibacillus yanchengensis]|uniref:Transporter suffix domain-containing protein n=2 Tax=Pontibacillus yanchengensis TaxID=462910 RepID=A0ACC7VKV5_9BACI|nr:transporter suffix domain-containing protein [Pontibacillus yanchengensis]MYL33666.1 transporter suffix domain-containing protein [Pontibacillus yanchengensis]MYL55437.1 transporter suffix domain-containing protein [Pontibacillus yanchengensis]